MVVGVRCVAVSVGCIAMALWFASACASTHQSPVVSPRGFLGDYSGLRKGGPGEAQLVYIDRSVDFAEFHRIEVEPVTVWHREGRDLSRVSKEDLQHLADYLDSAMRKQLTLDYELVDRAGPGVLRLRVAIVEARGANVPGNVVSTILPQGLLVSSIRKRERGTHAFVGGAMIEGELLDSVSNRRVFAAVDARAGGKTVKGMMTTWGDVYRSFDFWAERLRLRLESLRTEPVFPKEL